MLYTILGEYCQEICSLSPQWTAKRWSTAACATTMESLKISTGYFSLSVELFLFEWFVLLICFFQCIFISALTTWRPATAEWWPALCCASSSATSAAPLAMLPTPSGCFPPHWKYCVPCAKLVLRRYCPLNKDGTFSYGASLPQLKTRRNAAGNFSSRRFPLL